jgi:two-component system OmpR family response regulator
MESYNDIKKYKIMTNNKKSLLFLVDDDALFLKTLEVDLTQDVELSVKTFATGEQCLENLSKNPDIIVLDYYLNGIDANAINGIETLDRIYAINPLIPVIILSSQDKIDVAINCMKHRAFDYIVKSETSFIRLQKVIAYILHNQKTEEALNWYMNRMS